MRNHGPLWVLRVSGPPGATGADFFRIPYQVTTQAAGVRLFHQVFVIDPGAKHGCRGGLELAYAWWRVRTGAPARHAALLSRLMPRSGDRGSIRPRIARLASFLPRGTAPEAERTWRSLPRYCRVPEQMILLITLIALLTGLDDDELLRLRVVDPAGRPIAGAQILSQAWFADDGSTWDARSETDGTALLRPLVGTMTHSRPAAMVIHDGYAPTYLIPSRNNGLDLATGVALPEGTKHVGDVALWAGNTCRGTVRDARGQPVAGAFIAWLPWARPPFLFGRPEDFPIDSPRIARSGPDGSYQLPFLPVSPYVVAATAAGYSVQIATVQSDVASFQLEWVGTVTGCVIDAARRVPIAGAHINGSVATDAQGQFIASAKGWNSYDGDHLDIRLTREGYMASQGSVRASAGDDLGTIAMYPMATLEGRIVDESGRPVKAAVYTGTGRRAWAESPFAPVGDEDRITRADGSFRLRIPACVPVTLHAMHAQGTLHFPRIEAAPGETITRALVARPAFTLRGHVIERGTSQPIAKVHVTALTADTEEDLSRTTTAADGSFSLPDLIAEEELVIVAAHDQHVATMALLRPGASPSELVLEMEREAHLTGRVIDREGRPVAVARVGVEIHFPGPLRRMYGRHARVTDADGRFDFDQLGTTPITLSVQLARHDPRPLGTLTQILAPPFLAADWVLPAQEKR